MPKGNNILEPCGCMQVPECPNCGTNYDQLGITADSDGIPWHVHTCPYCGVDFKAHLESKP